MDQRTTGLILRIRPLTETSLIVQWLTADFGRLSTVAKGARRPKSPFAGKLDLFFLSDFSFHQSRCSELHSLREVSVRQFHTPLRRNLGYLQQACYFAQLIEQTTEPQTPLPGLLALLVDALETLSQNRPQALTVYAFEMKLLSDLGLAPDLDQANLTPGARVILERLTTQAWPILSQLKLSAEQNAEIDQFLRRFLIYHLGRVPPARAVATHDAKSASCL